MKTLKNLLAGALLLAFAGSASAQTYVRIVGAQAWRASIYASIGHILNSGYRYAYGSGTLSASNQAIFVGTTAVGGYSVIIKTSFAGATGGVATLTKNATISNFLADSTATSTSGTASVATYETAVTGDVVAVDSPQGTTVFTSPTLTASSTDPVGIEPYVWVKGSAPSSVTDAASFTNITSYQAQNLLNGGLPLQQFTGNSADINVNVLATGRDENSGARIVAYAESGFGVFSSPQQYQPTFTSSTITSLNIWPSNTLNGITYAAGHSGYANSSSVITALGAPITATVSGGPAWLVSYLGATDANSVNSGANNLTWNGIPYSVANVENGLYTFWGYAHLLYRSTYATSNATGKTVADQIAAQLSASDFSVSGVIPANMNVTRQYDGGPVTY
ncbi:MAG: hypothetical protein QM796_06740 [Chthoniobacteraceae bacterium]